MKDGDLVYIIDPKYNIIGAHGEIVTLIENGSYFETPGGDLFNKDGFLIARKDKDGRIPESYHYISFDGNGICREVEIRPATLKNYLDLRGKFRDIMEPSHLIFRDGESVLCPFLSDKPIKVRETHLDYLGLEDFPQVAYDKFGVCFDKNFDNPMNRLVKDTPENREMIQEVFGLEIKDSLANRLARHLNLYKESKIDLNMAIDLIINTK